MKATSEAGVIGPFVFALVFLLSGTPATAQVPGSQEKGATTIRMPVASDVPRAISQTAPVYPQTAVDARVEGNVVLHLIIGVDGAVKEVSAVSGPATLVPAAIEAVKEWKYQPFRLNIGPVELDTTVTLNFVLGPPPIVTVNNKPLSAFSSEAIALRGERRPPLLLAVDPDEAADIRRLLEATGMKNVVAAFFGSDLIGIRAELFRDLPASVDREKVAYRFQQELQKRIDSGQVLEAVIPIYAKHFTHEEIKEFLAFYESPAGRKYAQEAPSLVWEVHDASAPYWMDTVVPEVLKEMSVEYPELQNLK